MCPAVGGAPPMRGGGVAGRGPENRVPGGLSPRAPRGDGFSRPDVPRPARGKRGEALAAASGLAYGTPRAGGFF
jgi:hypothetical protein